MPNRRIGGAGNDLIDDDFNDGNLDGWSVNGTVVAANQRAEATVLAGGGDDEITQGIVAQDEIWLDYDVLIPSSGFVFPATSIMALGTMFSGGTQLIRLGIIELGSGLRWRTEYWTDGITANNTSEIPLLDTNYTITLHYKLETAPAAADGIAEIWIDDGSTIPILKILDIGNHINNTVQPNACHICNTSASAAVAGNVYCDNVKLGTFGGPPVRAIIGNMIDTVDLTELLGVLG